MALNTFKCNCLTPLHFEGLIVPRLYCKSKSFAELNFLYSPVSDLSFVTLLATLNISSYVGRVIVAFMIVYCAERVVIVCMLLTLMSCDVEKIYLQLSVEI